MEQPEDEGNNENIVYNNSQVSPEAEILSEESMEVEHVVIINANDSHGNSTNQSNQIVACTDQSSVISASGSARSSLCAVNVNDHGQGSEDASSSTLSDTSTSNESRASPDSALGDSITFEEEPRCNVESNQQSDSENSDQTSHDEWKSSERCIINPKYFLQKLTQTFDKHTERQQFCSFKDWELESTATHGMYTKFFFECRMCGHTDDFWSDPRGEDLDGIDLNEAAVSGTLTTGIGFAQFEELCAAINITCMSETSYRKYRDKVIGYFEKAASAAMKEAADEERKLAFAAGDFIIYEGRKIALIAVVADGQWSRRSYGHTYNALSGAVAIVGYRTNKVLYYGVENKFCSLCDFYERDGVEPRQHACYKTYNRNDPSTKMESDLIVEGFSSSLETHGLIYKTLIADNDSSVWKAILDRNPYDDQDILVEKIECINHLLRNLCKKIQAIKKITNKQNDKGEKIPRFVELRKKLVESSIVVRLAIEDAIDHRRASATEITEEMATELQKDIWNIPFHLFGDHSLCSDRGLVCESEDETNYVPLFTECRFWEKLEAAVNYVATHAHSLLHRKSNNFAEAFNSIINKYIGGKRVFYGGRNAYNGRVAAAVLQYNTQNVLCRLYESRGQEPPAVAQKIETRRRRKNDINKICRQNRDPNARNKRRGFADQSYGPNCDKPPVDETVKLRVKNSHFERLKADQLNWVNVEKDTRAQGRSNYWLLKKKRMLTASKFGEVCRMRATTDRAPKVHSICYPKQLTCDAVQHGTKLEKEALIRLAEKIGQPIKNCGLFIDQQSAFLGATPDGLVGENALVEVKCPYQARNKTIEEAMSDVKCTRVRSMFDKDDRTKMNKNNVYYYQVQGQLHITKRDLCYFAVYTGTDLKYVEVERDDNFWAEKMEPKLISFYHEYLEPEIVNRLCGMPPSYQPGRRTRANNSGTQRSTQEIANAEREAVAATENELEGYENEILEWNDETRAERIEYLKNARASLRSVRHIVLNPEVEMNDACVDTFLKILRETSVYETQSVQYVVYRDMVERVKGKSIQVIGGSAARHWRCFYYDEKHLYVYDSLRQCSMQSLNANEKEYLRLRFGNMSEDKFIFEDMHTRQPDNVSCGVYACAVAATLLFGGNPAVQKYSSDVEVMREHLVRIIETQNVTEFPG